MKKKCILRDVSKSVHQTKLLKGILEVGCYYQRCFRGCRVFNWPLLRPETSSMTKARAGHCWWNFCHLPFTRICQPRKIRVILHHVREYTASGQWTSCFVIGGNQVCAVLMGWKREGGVVGGDGGVGCTRKLPTVGSGTKVVRFTGPWNGIITCQHLRRTEHGVDIYQQRGWGLH